MEKVKFKLTQIEDIKQILDSTNIYPEEVNTYLFSKNSSQLINRQKASQLLLRPSVSLPGLVEAIDSLKNSLKEYHNEALEQAEIQVKYQSYLDKEKELVSRMSLMEDLTIPDSFDYAKINSLSNEARQKFIKIKPKTLGQASRISGVNPSDVQILMVYMGR